MKNKNVLVLTMFGTLGISGFSQKNEKLNVLFIMADDLNNNLGCYEHYLVKTPHLDRLAQQGVLFNNAYCQLPLSGPSRASMLTGRMASSINFLVNENYIRTNYPDIVTLPQMFSNHGYFAGRVGKLYHYGVPGDIGTDGHDDTLSWQKRVNPKGRDKWDEKNVINFSPSRGLGTAAAYMIAEGSDEEQTDGMIATETIKMIAEHKHKPFFIAAGFFRPHCPYIAPKKYFDMYPLEEIRLPKNPVDDLEDVPTLAKWSNSKYIESMTEEQKKTIIQAYYASISFIDAQVGRLLNALDSMGLSKNTIIVFISDHGYSLGEHYLWQKMNLFEEASRVPMIIYNPEMKSELKKSNHLVELLDIYPTLADFCKLSPPSDLEGKSMRCIFEGKDVNWKKGAVTEVSRPADKKDFDSNKPNGGFIIRGKTVRTDRWRYTEWDEGKSGVELYDHLNDPSEFTNLAGKPEFVKEIEELKRLLK